MIKWFQVAFAQGPSCNPDSIINITIRMWDSPEMQNNLELYFTCIPKAHALTGRKEEGSYIENACIIRVLNKAASKEDSNRMTSRAFSQRRKWPCLQVLHSRSAQWPGFTSYNLAPTRKGNHFHMQILNYCLWT